MAYSKYHQAKIERKEADFNKMSKEDKDLYIKVEQAVISWTIDGHKTAGTLTREIMNIIKK